MNRRQRRREIAARRTRLSRSGYAKKYNGFRQVDVAEAAMARLKDILIRYGNTLSAEHELALFALLAAMTRMAQRRLKGRVPFPIPTGMGKTSAIIAFCATLADLGLDHVSVAVSASKVEALCALKRDMIEAGVPAEKIGLIHSKLFNDNKADAIKRGELEGDQYASEPSVGVDRQFILVTHQRVRGTSLDRFNTYRGKPRDLLIYDESLLVSDSLGLLERELRRSLNYCADKADEREDTDLRDYLLECRRRIEYATEALQEGQVACVSLPDIDPDQKDQWRRKVPAIPPGDKVAALLDISDQDVQVTSTGARGVVWYRVSVPPELENIIILDASYPIRALCHLDPTIIDSHRVVPEAASIPYGTLKRFDHVTIRQLFAGGGRASMEKLFSKPKDEAREITQEIVEVIKAAPADEAVLAFVYKQRGGIDYRKILIEDLQKAGIDVDAKTPEGEPRINIATWGSETSLNSYSHCQHVILVGVLHRSLIDLEAAYMGQTGGAEDAIGSVLTNLRRSEISHLIYQALSRGCCRRIVDEQAKPMIGYIIHLRDDIQAELKKVMPGIRFKEWTPKHLVATTGGEIAKLAMRIGDALDSMGPSVPKVSTRALKKAMDVGSHVPSRTWTYAVKAFVEKSPVWRMEGRSLVKPAADFI